MTPQSHSILLVDDDDLFRNRMEKALIKRGYNVLTASNYSGGVQIIAQIKPAYAIVDLKMSGKSGLELIKTGIRHHPDLSIVVLTGYGSIATAMDAIKLGATGYLTKPTDIDDILKTLVEDEKPRTHDNFPAPSLARVEWEHINRILHDCNNNISMAAKTLGIHRRTLQRKLQKYPPLV